MAIDSLITIAVLVLAVVIFISSEVKPCLKVITGRSKDLGATQTLKPGLILIIPLLTVLVLKSI